MASPNPDLIPRFKSSLRVEVVAQDRLMLIGERQRSIICDRATVQVAPWIDGQHTTSQIIAALKECLPVSHVLHVLAHLTKAGHLQTQAEQHAPAARAYWELLCADGDGALNNLAQRAVTLQAIGGLTIERLAATLAAAAIGVADSARLKIILTDDYLRPELAHIAAQAAQAGVALLLVKPVGLTPTIGPLIHPQFGACLTCLQFWIRHNHPVENLISRLQDGAPCHLPLAQGSAAELAVYGLLAANLAHLLALQEDRIPLKTHLLALDLQCMESKRHAVQQRAQCPACGDPQHMARQAERFPQPQSVPDLLCKDGGYRRRDPLQTYERYRHLVSPITGPIAYLHPMPRRHSGMRKVYVAGYLVCPQQIPHDNSFDKICAGKGQTDEQARASALCEALERYSGVYQGDEARVRASMAELIEQEQRVLDFNALQNFSDAQYAEREAINRQTDDRRRHVPERFLPDSVIDWTFAWSLISKQKIHLPLTYCYAEAPAASGAAYGIHNPNGAAAGNCLEEAILQGFLELIERDATAIWWYNRIARPAIDLASFADPYFDRLVEDYAAIGWNLWVLDLTHDLGIAVCAAVAHQPQEDRYAIGFGCHLNAQLAVQRALTEVNQLFDPAGNSPAPWDRAKLAQAQFLFGQGAPRKADAMPSRGGVDLQTDIAYCAEVCAAHGLDLLVLNKTRPDIGLNVVQVIVPGLRHFWPRFGGGRLYTVAPVLGWLPHPLPEAGLNPAPLFL
jgi:ribosomal protein S12 methylthiotransferase accessory factor